MSNMSRRTTALLVCLTLAASGCATTGTRGITVVPTADRAVIAEYVRALPAGSAIQVQRTDGRSVRGTLMKATDQSLIIQPRARIPEPPLEIALTDVIAVTPERTGGTSVGKAIGIGIAAGVGATLAFLAILAALYAD